MDQFTIRKVTNNLALNRSKAEKLLVKASRANNSVAVPDSSLSPKTERRQRKKASLLY